MYIFLTYGINEQDSFTENEVSFYTAEYRIPGNEGALITKANVISNKTKTALSTLTETVDAEDLDVHVRFINHFNASDYELPSAGFDDSRPMRTLIFAAALIFGSLIVYRRRRRIR